MKNQKIKKAANLIGVFVLSIVFGISIQAQSKPPVEKISVSPETEINANQNSPVKDNASAEQRLIEQTYRKLSIYEAVDRISKANSRGEPKGKDLADKSLKFKFSNFHLGPIQEILNVKYKDLVTPPTGEIIRIMPTTTENKKVEEDGTITYDEPKYSVDAKWVSGQYASGADVNWSVGDILQLEPLRFRDVGKYASYEVTVSLEGKKRTYLAMTFFNNSFQSSAALKPDFLDSIVGMGGTVNNVFSETKLPLGLARAAKTTHNTATYDTGKSTRIKTKGRVNPSPNLLGNECTFSMYDFGEGCDCIDWMGSMTVCAVEIWLPVIGTGSGSPAGCFSHTETHYEPNIEKQPGYEHHKTGSHWGSARFNTECAVTSDCWQHCRVRADAGFGEDGETTNYVYYHVGNAAGDTKSGDGPRGTNITCEAAVGVAYKECISPNCNVTLTVSIGAVGATVNVSNELWKHSFAHTGTCNEQ